MAFALTLNGAAFLRAGEPADAPRPVPLTRPEMKQLIEDMKVRTPRIPFPELSEEDRATLGDRADDYESVLRYCYTPWVEQSRGPRGSSSRNQEPAMTLDYAFKVELFWIVSRVNNCQYCIGHQESKLLAAGLMEDQIAALDGDWSGHTPAERAAFAFARKLSYQPHEISDADIDGLRNYYTDLQILEMVLSISRNNISNRTHEAIGVPQRQDEGGYSRNTEDPSLPRGSYLTPTSEEFQDVVTQVAPVELDAAGQPTRATVCRRPALESPEEVEHALALCREREPRLPLVDEQTARAVLSESAPNGPLPSWMRLLANFPEEGGRQIRALVAAEEQGDLSPLLKAQLSWIIARQDRAWYATGEAQQRLRDLGQTDEQIDALDGDWNEFTPRERSLFVMAQKLAASPVVLTDADVAEAVELAGPRDVVQAGYYTSLRTSFNRATEAAGLPLEE
jgi:alkylhydroperoxidase family enzyme